MRPEQTPVKGSRRYDASGRQARAQAKRDATLERAAELFLERGYVATTVEAVAAAAEVSEATIYKTYGGKAGLVRELCRRALAGAGSVPAEERSNALRSSRSGRRIVEGWGDLVAEVSPRVSPLLLLLRTAATSDHEAARLLDELEQARLDRMADNADQLVVGGHLRDGVTPDEARDVLWLCSSPELYELLVLRRGWSPDRLAAFVTGTMAGALLRRGR